MGGSALWGSIVLAFSQESFTKKGPGEHDVIDLVDRLMSEALRVEASDVHVEPTVGATLVRYRIDGVLHEVAEYPPSNAAGAVISARQDHGQTEHRRAAPAAGRPHQDPLGDASIDLRVSTLPDATARRSSCASWTATPT